MANIWSFGLIEKLKDESNIILKTNELAVIQDSFPKSRYHFLIIPFDESLDSILDLSSCNINLIDEFELLAINLIELIGNRKENFKIGFHAVPSMKR